MNQRHIARVLAILACAILLSACLASDDTPPGLPQTGDFPLSVRVVDNWGNSLADASLYINSAVTPTATTGADGTAVVTLNGPKDDLVATRVGHRSYAYLERDFSALEQITVILDRQADLLNPPGSGTISFTVTGGPPNSFAFVQAWSITAPVQTGIVLDGNGDGSGELVAQAGEYVLVVRPNATNLPAAETYYGK